MEVGDKLLRSTDASDMKHSGRKCKLSLFPSYFMSYWNNEMVNVFEVKVPRIALEFMRNYVISYDSYNLHSSISRPETTLTHLPEKHLSPKPGVDNLFTSSMHCKTLRYDIRRHLMTSNQTCAGQKRPQNLYAINIITEYAFYR